MATTISWIHGGAKVDPLAEVARGGGLTLPNTAYGVTFTEASIRPSGHTPGTVTVVV